MPTIRTFLVLSFAGGALAFGAPSAMADSPVDAGSDDGAPLVGDFEGSGPVDSPDAPPLSPEEQRDAPRGGDFEGTPGVDDSPAAPAAEGDPLPGGDPAARGSDAAVTVRMVAANSAYRVSYKRAARHHHGHGHRHHRGAH